MKHAIAFALAFALVAGAFASPAPQDTTAGSGTSTGKKAVAKRSEPSVSTQLSEMKRAIDAQQQQIQQLMNQLQSRDAVIQQLQQQVGQVQSAVGQAAQKADTAVSQTTQQQQDVAAVKSDVTDLKQNVTNAALSLQETQKNVKDALESPLAIHYKGITITPGGFLAGETVWRQHALGSDINTPFNSIPFPGAAQSNMSEFFGSGRQSRISALAEGKLNSAKLSGYFESDWLGAGITSNNNESNSYVFRVRQAFAQAALSDGWSFTGGQMWSLVTETKKGVDNRTEALPMTIDPQYNVGFSWARQYGFRVAKDLNNKVWLAFSVEDSQATLGGHGASNNFIIGEQGTSSGLYNPTANYSFNPSPDFVGKLAFEPGWGHFEVFGIVTDFRDRIYPLATASKPSATGAFNNSAPDGGIGGNFRGTVAKHIDIGVHFLGGNGTGRYGSAGLVDVIARPDGVLVPVRNYQALGTLEWHSPRLDVYANVGGEYEGRTAFVSNKKGVGYGSPLFNNSGCGTETPPAATTITVATPPTATDPKGGTASIPVPGSVGTPLTGGFNPGGLADCNGDTRNIMEGTIGFWYRIYAGPKGRIQWGPQYSYIDRNTWAGVGGNPNATENMFLTSFRYYLP
jgi:archaellum component FlaC